MCREHIWDSGPTKEASGRVHLWFKGNLDMSYVGWSRADKTLEKGVDGERMLSGGKCMHYHPFSFSMLGVASFGAKANDVGILPLPCLGAGKTEGMELNSVCLIRIHPPRQEVVNPHSQEGPGGNSIEAEVTVFSLVGELRIARLNPHPMTIALMACPAK